jgi:hypothetical protein
MFGYVTVDKPNMLIKDFTMYRAFYCGICKSLGQHYGQLKRFLTNYDVTFLAVLIHSILGKDIVISNEKCILNPIKKRSIVKDNDLMSIISDVTVLLAGYKIKDDIEDDKSIKKKTALRILKRALKKATKNQPEIAEIINSKMQDLSILEKEKSNNLDKVCHPFASMLDEILRILIKDKYNEKYGNIIYNIGRWIYIADAIDDIEKDYKKNAYNPYLVDCKDFTTKKDFIQKHYEDLTFALMSAYNAIKYNYSFIENLKYEGILTNIIWYGLLSKTNEVLKGECKCKQKLHK